MNSRERLEATLGHRQPDRVCVDLGAAAALRDHAWTRASWRYSLSATAWLCSLSRAP